MQNFLLQAQQANDATLGILGIFRILGSFSTYSTHITFSNVIDHPDDFYEENHLKKRVTNESTNRTDGHSLT